MQVEDIIYFPHVNI